MTSPAFVLCLICFILLLKMAPVRTLKQSFLLNLESAAEAEAVSLSCSCHGDGQSMFYWYKQSVGQIPKQVCSVYEYNSEGVFYDEFNNTRFSLDTRNSEYHLKISDLLVSDSATYYCMRSDSLRYEFCSGTIVIVEGSGETIPALVHQSTSGTIQSGDSVTLNCTVHTGTCDGEHSVYWFKHSEESHPGLIYTHGGRNDQCERKDNTQTHTCVYNLPLKDLDVSHAGTYYCAVASCGHILFGNGTKLDFKDDRVLVYFLSSTLAFTATIPVIILAFSMYRIKQRSSSQSPESQARCSTPSTEKAKDLQDADRLYYAALSTNLTKRPRRQRNQTWTECVYHSVQQ